jgi:hypothetical protein
VTAQRQIVRADGPEWLAANAAPPGTSVVTSIPDLSETSLELGPWRAWTIDVVRRILRWIPGQGVAIFYQSDLRRGGVWVDKGYLVQRGVELEEAALVWHKIVCRKLPGTVSLGRPTYSHMICAARSPRPPPRKATPDVLPDAGFMSWSKAMGVEACKIACSYLADETATKLVVDPFCGNGTALAVANAMGLDAIGVDSSARRCRAARRLIVDLDAVTTGPI